LSPKFRIREYIGTRYVVKFEKSTWFYISTMLRSKIESCGRFKVKANKGRDHEVYKKGTSLVRS